MANNFSGDSNCVALYRFEDDWENEDHHPDDSIGSNVLSYQSFEPARTATHWEGSYACDVTGKNAISGWYCDDANLDAGFPCRHNDASPEKAFSVTLGFRAESLPAASGWKILAAKYYTWGAANGRSFAVALFNNSGSVRVRFYKGYNSGANYEYTDNTGLAISTGQWYHVGVTYDDSDKSVRIRVWDDSGSTVYDETDTHVQAISVLDRAFTIGCQKVGTSSFVFDGIVDEVAVFKDVLSADEIDQIRQGNYSGGSGVAGYMRLGKYWGF